MNRRRARLVLLLTMSILLAGGLAEGFLRLYAGVNPYFGRRMRENDPFAVLVEPHGELGYRQRANTTLEYSNGTAATSNEMGYRGPMVEVPKPLDRVRIVLLGGSTTHGWQVNDDDTIDAHLRRVLRERHPAMQFDVVNLAYDGYDAYQAFERFRTDGVPLEPDLVIVNSGINDVRNTRFPNLEDRDPRTIPWAPVLRRLRLEEAQGGPNLRLRLKHHSYVLRLVSSVRAIRRPGTRSSRNLPSHPAEPTLDAADSFERNLRRIADLAVVNGVAVIYSTPPSSIPLSFAPDSTTLSSYWLTDAASTQAYRDTLAGRAQRLARELGSAEHPVSYGAPTLLDPGLFLDDCHLTSEGNHAVAVFFAELVNDFILTKPPRPAPRAGV